MKTTIYLVVGILASFVLLTTLPRENRIEAFQEESFLPALNEPTINAVTGEIVYGNPNGVLLDQGQQSLRVGATDVIVYTSGKERMRIMNSGTIGVGVSSNVTNQSSGLLVNGSVSLVGSTVFNATPSTFNSYFLSPFGTYINYGGMNVIDNSSLQTNVFSGEWVQLQLPSAIFIGSYILAPVVGLGNNGNPNVPNSFQLLGSNDNSTWYLIDRQTDQRNVFDGTPKRTIYNVSAPIAYRYFRLVINQIVASAAIGPVMELCSWMIVDNKNQLYPPSPMSNNTQVLNGGTYVLAASSSSGNSFSYINNTLQAKASYLVGLVANGTTLQSSNYYQLEYQQANTSYSLSSDSTMWIASGQTSTTAYLSPQPYQSVLTFNSIYNASAPVECMRVYYDGTSSYVGIGTTVATSNLSVLGTMDTSYSSFQNGVSTLAKNKSNSNLVYASSSLGTSVLNFCSADSTGRSAANLFDCQIVSSGGTVGTPGKGTMTLSAGSVNVSSGSVNVSSGAVNVSSGAVNVSATGDMNVSTTGAMNVSTTGAMNLSGAFALNQWLYSSNQLVGIGTSTPYATLHVDQGSVLISNGSAGGSLMFNPSTTSNYSPMALIQGEWTSSNATAKQNSGGLGFLVRPDNSSASSSLVEAMNIFSSGQVGINSGISVYGVSGITVGPDTVRNARLWYNSSAYLDYYNTFTTRLNTSSDPLMPSYQSILTMSNNGLVGIGSVSPGAVTRGNSSSYGLDIGYAGGSVDALRLINTSNLANNSGRNVGIQFVITDTSPNAYQKLQARIVGNSSDLTNASLGSLDFYVKCNDTAPSANNLSSDSLDVSLRASVVPSGFSVGNGNIPFPFSMYVGNSLGAGQFGVAAANGHYSVDAVAGDMILRAEPNHNLYLQSGSYKSAICLLKNSTNVGMGSTAPKANLDILGTTFMNGATPVTTLSASTPLGIGQVPQGVNYVLNVASQDISNIALPNSQSFNYCTQSINLQSGSMLNYTYSGVAYNSYGARMTINGGKTLTTGSSSAPNQNATIDFFTAGDNTNPVVRIGQRGTYNTSQSYTFMGYNTTYLSTLSQNIIGYSIYATDNIMVTNGASFMAISDQRLKKNIEPLDSSSSLRKIESLEMVSYDMRDHVQQPGKRLGVIAQQVQEIIPEAIKKGKSEYVANILVMVEVERKENSTQLNLSRRSDHPVKQGDSIRMISSTNQMVEARIIRIDTDLHWVIDKEVEEEKWMVFGTREDDILSVDKDTISMVAVSALQELSLKHTKLERKVQEMEERMEEMVSMMSNILRADS